MRIFGGFRVVVKEMLFFLNNDISTVASVWNEDLKREGITVVTDRFLLRSSYGRFRSLWSLCVRGFRFLMLSSAKTVSMDTPLVYLDLA